MILDTQYDAGYLNEIKARSRAGACIFLSEDDPIPKINGSILTIAQIVKSVMSSATKAELTALFVTAKKIVPFRHTFTEMGWHQPKSPIQAKNSTAVGLTNTNMVSRATKSIDMQLWWLRDRKPQN